MATIITLITDFRTSDGYMGAIFGVIKSINPNAEIITIASNIPAADIRKASQALSNSYRFYPKGSIHMVVVDPSVGPRRRALIVDDGRYLLLGPDNGVLSPIYRNNPESRIRQISNDKYRLTSRSETFHGRDLFAPAAAYLSHGIPPEEFGPEITDPVMLDYPQLEVIGNDLVGRVIDIDAFGNLITNISANYVDNDAVIQFCGRTIHGLSRCYSDVPEKHPLAYIGSSDTLEIAINRGDAANYFGALINEEVRLVGAGRRIDV